MRRFLVAEGDTVNRDYLLCILEPFGSCVSTGSGQEALNLFRAARERGEPFDVAVLDRLLPGLDGPDLARRLAALQGAAGRDRTRLILLTASESAPLDREALAGLAVDAALARPVTRRQILDTLTALDVSPRI